MNIKNLWAPWREPYILGLVDDDKQQAKPECFICALRDADPANDEENLVLHRSELGFIIMNRYPYTGGHMLVCPYDHLGDLTDFSKETRYALMDLTALAEKALKLSMNPQGINVGINIGRAAGAGVPGHLHVHVVPRWSGDVNFMEVVGQVNLIPLSQSTIYRELKKAIATLLEHENKD